MGYDEAMLKPSTMGHVEAPLVEALVVNILPELLHRQMEEGRDVAGKYSFHREVAWVARLGTNLQKIPLGRPPATGRRERGRHQHNMHMIGPR